MVREPGAAPHIIERKKKQQIISLLLFISVLKKDKMYIGGRGQLQLLTRLRKLTVMPRGQRNRSMMFLKPLAARQILSRTYQRPT